MRKKCVSLSCLLLILAISWGCKSNDSSQYTQDESMQSESTQLIIYDEYEVEMISCSYDETIGLVNCIFEIEKVDGTSEGLKGTKCSWGENDNYYLMPCATGERSIDCEYDNQQNKKYITFKQVARIWVTDESKGTIELYDDNNCVGVFNLIPDNIDSETFSIEEGKTIYITENGLCAKGDFVFQSDAQLTIVYEDGSTIDVFKDGRDNYNVGNWGSSSGGGLSVYTFIFHEPQAKKVEKIIYNGDVFLQGDRVVQ